jgi:nicotinamide riboside kinase
MICTVVEKILKPWVYHHPRYRILVRQMHNFVARFGHILEQMHFSFAQLQESNSWTNRFSLVFKLVTVFVVARAQQATFMG